MERGGQTDPGHRSVVTGRTSTRPSYRLGVVLALGVLLQAACSTTYQPRRSGQVGVVIHHAAAMFVQDGREHPIGPFTGDLEGLVREQPEAAAHAHKAHVQLMVGVPTYVTGAAGVIVGVLVLSGPVGWVVIGLGASALATGLGLMGAAVTEAIDAVNIHNDVAAARAIE